MSFVALPLALTIAAAVAAASAPADPRDLAYQARTVAEVDAQLGVRSPEPGPKLLLETPDIVAGAEHGAVSVAVKFTTRMPGTDWMALMVEGSDRPLVVYKDFTPGTDLVLEAKVQLNTTARVRAVARVGGKYYQVSREVKVAHRALRKP